MNFKKYLIPADPAMEGIKEWFENQKAKADKKGAGKWHDPDFDENYKSGKPINLSSLYFIEINRENIKDMKRQYGRFINLLTCPKNTRYLLWIDQSSDTCAAEAHLDIGTRTIWNVQVRKEYQGHGLFKQILQFCLKKYGCNNIEMDDASKYPVAVKGIERAGFKTEYRDDKTDVSGYLFDYK